MNIPASYQLVESVPVAALRGVAHQFVHTPSGAKILHFACEDIENAFSINFPTPPDDNTGKPHILEHSVLAGSKKFPVKEPFFEMIKMSPATFINALTGNDMTYYPVSSCVKKDLFNLADVYFDAVFSPLLSEDTFLREAHHLALDAAGALRRDGVVYSEMKGVFSDPEAILERINTRSLLPDTCHGFESGGDPEAIPELTVDGLRDFHRTFYSPANALIILYGNIPTEDYLDFLDARLSELVKDGHFSKENTVPPTARQQKWQEPKTLREYYPTDGSAANKTYLSMSWLTGDALSKDVPKWAVLSDLLLGYEGAPLYKALVDSHLGTNVISDAASSAGQEATFQIGIEGSEADRAEDFKKLVLGELKRIAETPFTEREVQSAFQQAAYAALEIGPAYPLRVIFSLVAPWAANLPPTSFADTAALYDELREEYKKDPLVFNRLIQTGLLSNPHRLDVILMPDLEMAQRLAKEDEKKMAKLKESFSAAEIEKINSTCEALERANATPNSPEAVALLPKLALSDIPRIAADLPTTRETMTNGNAFLVTDLATNGVVYATFSFDLEGLPRELWEYLPRFTDAVSRMGTKKNDFVEISLRKTALTGGIGASLQPPAHVSNPYSQKTHLNISIKTLSANLEPALDLLEEILFELDAADEAHLKDVLTQATTNIENELTQNGLSTASVYAGRMISLPGYLSNLFAGLPQLALLKTQKQTAIAEAITKVRDFLLSRERLTVSVAASANDSARVKQRAETWLERMPDRAGDGRSAANSFGFVKELTPRVEALSAPLQVAFTAMLMPGPHYTEETSVPFTIGTHLISSDYMLPELRLKGNAYGAHARYNPTTGTISFTTYRDPHVLETIATMRRVMDFVEKYEWRKEDVDAAIISLAKDSITPVRPTQAAGVALARYYSGADFSKRNARLQELLGATPKAAKDATVAVLEKALCHTALCTVASEAMLAEAQQKIGMKVRPVIDVQ